MTTFDKIAVLATCAVVALLVAPRGADAQYNPEKSPTYMSQVRITVSPGDRVNDNDSVWGWFGVEKCKDLENRDEGQATFTFERNPTIPLQNFRLPEFYLMEFNPDKGLDGTCNPEDGFNACRRLDDDEYDGVWIRDNQWPYEVRIEFDTLRNLDTFADEQTIEDCAYASASNAMFAPSVPLSSHAGDAGSEADTGTGDASTVDGGSDANTTSTAYGGDRAYLVRLHFEARETINTPYDDILVDAPLVFDRTRPDKPSDLEAKASENIIRMRFTPPEDRTRLESYWVYYSTSNFASSIPPENPGEIDGIWRKLVGNAQADTDQRTETVRGINRKAGSKLWIAVVSQDNAKNLSQYETLGSATTVQPSIDFWEKYHQAGGKEYGGCGCSASGTNPSDLLWSLLGLGLLTWSTRRRRLG